jgi:uncharacterized protein (TIGR02646 family)
MIWVSQGAVPVPSVFDEEGTHTGEREKAIKHYGNTDNGEKSFPFQIYRNAEVKQALTLLFHGKCAYCESRYAATQPMDVEHWRPKGGVEACEHHMGSRGYYWLAGTWSNLLPSCIDCNRVREHRFEPDGVPRKSGKGNHFPLVPGSTRATDHTHDMAAEQPVLLNPYLDEPVDYLDVGAEAVMCARADVREEAATRASESIRIYALNRTDLVHERKALKLRIEHHIHIIRRLSALLDGELAPDVDDLVDDLLSHEMKALQRCMEPSQPYSFLAKRLIEPFLKEMRGE